MGLLGRIFQELYLVGLTIIKASFVDDTYYESKIIAWLTSILRLLTLVGFFVLPLYLLVWAISCKIFVQALILAYLEAWLWSKLADKLTTLVQELYLVMSTVGYTVLIGTAIQLNRMPWAGSTILVFYWILLLILGWLIWRITRISHKPEPKSARVIQLLASWTLRLA